MKTKTLLPLFILFSFTLHAQKQFFKSTIDFSEDNLRNFYSSLAVDAASVYFVANDYNIYSYDKKEGSQKWQCFTNYKTVKAPYIMGDTLIAGYYGGPDTGESAAFINKNNGILVKELPFEPLSTLPHFKNGIMYCTAVYKFGQILAYDIKNDSVIWDRFIAHGVSTQPVYLENKIIANAEDTNWFELSYDNKLLGTCNNPAGYVEDITCVENYKFLSHDGKKITSDIVNKYFEEAYGDTKHFLSKYNTFITDFETIVILGNKAKVKHVIKTDDIIYNLTDADGNGLEITPGDYFGILKADEKSVWFIAYNILVVLDLKTAKATKTYNLAQWQPHQALLDGNNLWLINRADGQLYGLTLD